MRASVVLFASLILVGCGTRADQKDGKQPPPNEAPPVLAKAEARETPSGESEELVAVWLKRNINKPELKFVKFGPHLQAEEVRKMFAEAGIEEKWETAAKKIVGADFDVLIRVVFRIKGKGNKNPLLAGTTGLDVGDGMTEHDLVAPVKGKSIPGDIREVNGGVYTEHLKHNHLDGNDWKAQLRKTLGRDHPSIKE